MKKFESGKEDAMILLAKFWGPFSFRGGIVFSLKYVNSDTFLKVYNSSPLGGVSILRRSADFKHIKVFVSVNRLPKLRIESS